MKLEFLTPLADNDVVQAFAFYEKESPALALRFIQEFKKLVMSIRLNPAIGSQRFGHLISGMRARRLAQFPYLVLYREQPLEIEVLRVLHVRRDLPSALAETEYQLWH